MRGGVSPATAARSPRDFGALVRGSKTDVKTRLTDVDQAANGNGTQPNA
jgi:hypothetical protein